VFVGQMTDKCLDVSERRTRTLEESRGTAEAIEIVHLKVGSSDDEPTARPDVTP